MRILKFWRYFTKTRKNLQSAGSTKLRAIFCAEQEDFPGRDRKGPGRIFRPGPCCQRGLSLDAAGGQSADQILFNAHEENHHRDDGEDGGGEEVLPLNHVVAVKDVDAHSQGLVGVRGDEAQGHGVLVPGVDENKDQRGNDARGRHGQEHPGLVGG